MDAFTEYFGENTGKVVHQALQEESLAIQFLQNASEVDHYLEGQISIEKEQQVLTWRAEIPWFDCAIAILENFDPVVSAYKEDKVYHEAQNYLRLYYRPRQERIVQGTEESRTFQNIWYWLLQQKNPIINGFLETWKETTTIALPVSSGHTTYENGDPYQNIFFKVPLPKEYDFADRELVVQCQISFYWIARQEFIEDKTWGKIKVQANEEYKFPPEQTRQFLSMLYVDLYYKNQGQRQEIAQNLKCSRFGEFEIKDGTKKAMVKTALEKNSLVCVVKLTSY